jgi:2-iminobutanoate/2-iminopropanoate deaminase
MDRIPVVAGSQAPGAPYTPGIVFGNLVFVSGQVPMNPDTRQIVEGEFEEHVRQCLANVQAILKQAGSDLEHCVKVTVFLKDMNNFARLNAVYNTYFDGVKPARTCVEVARLPLDVQVEIEAVAVVPDGP